MSAMAGDSSEKTALRELFKARKRLELIVKERNIIWEKTAQVCERLQFLKNGVLPSAAFIICSRTELYLAVLGIFKEVESRVRRDVMFMESVFDEWYDHYSNRGNQHDEGRDMANLDSASERYPDNVSELSPLGRDVTLGGGELHDDEYRFAGGLETENYESENSHHENPPSCQHWQFTRFFWSAGQRRTD